MLTESEWEIYWELRRIQHLIEYASEKIKNSKQMTNRTMSIGED